MLITHFSQQNYFFSASFWCGHISILLFTLCINFQKICFPLKWKRGHWLKPFKCNNVFQKHHTNGTRHQRNRLKVEGALDRAGPGRAKETKSKSPSYLLDPTLPDSRATPGELQCHLKVSAFSFLRGHALWWKQAWENTTCSYLSGKLWLSAFSITCCYKSIIH